MEFSQPMSASVSLKVEKTFETELENIHNVVSGPDDFHWIHDFSLDILQKVKPEGESLSVISNIKINVYDAALLSSGDLLLSVSRSSNLKLIPSGSTEIQDSVYTVSPLNTSCVHVTFDNKVIVGALDELEIPATGPTQVIVMDNKGNHENVFQYDSHNKPLFTFPHRITSNKRGNIAVIDMISEDMSGRVVVLSQEGEVRNIYTGHPDVINEDNPFILSRITTTPSDNFVVADPSNHTLHILNGEGEFITFYNTEEIGILLPFSLSFSTTGQLYVGCDNYKDSKEKAKLYQVSFFDIF